MSKKLKFLAMVLTCILLSINQVWGTPTVLLHETFGENTGSVRDWDDNYKDQSGVSDVYSDASYTITNAGQSKNTGGCTSSGLLQRTQGTDASFVIGPLDVSDYEDLAISFTYKAGSTKKTYSRSAQYKTSSSGVWADLSVSGTMAASTCNEQTASLPAAADGISTLYIKIVFNTSNSQAVIDEFELTGTEAAGSTYTVNYSNGPFSPRKPFCRAA